MVNILIVEDELIVAMELKSRLYDLGYSVCGIVASGEEAISRTIMQKPDIILMDINIKGAFDGIKTAEIIKADHDIPIIFITAFVDPKTLQRAKITEPYGYIIKPFEERELHTAIEIALYKHNMEKKLRNSERRLSITLKSIGDGVIATNKEGIISYINPAAENLICCSHDEAIGKNIIEILHIQNEDIGIKTNTAIKELIQDGATNNFPDIMIIVRKDGKEMIIESNVASIKDDKKNIEGLVLSFRDITERKKMEEKLNIALEKSEEANRLKSVFLSNMSHELRTPMSGILSFAQILKEELNDQQYKEMADMMFASGKRLLSTLDAILEFSKLESGKMESVLKEINITDLTEDLLGKFAKLIQEKGLNLSLEVKDKKPMALTDEKLLRQALENIIGNAIKFTKTGKITLDVNKIVLYDKEWVTIGIADTGIGIADEKLSIIFEEFRQASEGVARNYEGNGLGLAISKKIVELMQGYITVESQNGRGSKFIVHLPSVADENENTVEVIKMEPGSKRS
jgi:PAS domain S-box-containing protein